APAGQHDHPDRRVLFGAVDRGVKPRSDVGAPGVEALRAIEGQDCDAARRGLVAHRVVGSTVATGHLPRHLLAPAQSDSAYFVRITVYLSVPHSTTAATPSRTATQQRICGAFRVSNGTAV